MVGILIGYTAGIARLICYWFVSFTPLFPTNFTAMWCLIPLELDLKILFLFLIIDVVESYFQCDSTNLNPILKEMVRQAEYYTIWLTWASSFLRLKKQLILYYCCSKKLFKKRRSDHPIFYYAFTSVIVVDFSWRPTKSNMLEFRSSFEKYGTVSLGDSSVHERE